MRAALALAFGLSVAPALTAGQSGQQSDEALTTSSIRRIRAELERTPRVTLDIVEETPHFQMIIRAAQRFTDDTEFHFSIGPVPPGGLHAFEARRQAGPQLAQPLVVVDVMPIGRALARAIQGANNAARHAAARDEVRREIEEYCAARPERGAGIQMCSISAAIR